MDFACVDRSRSPTVAKCAQVPDLKFVGVPADMKQNHPPSEGDQFFGTGRVDARGKVLTVSLRGAEGQKLHSVEMLPKA